jgi:hypothetical protein
MKCRGDPRGRPVYPVHLALPKSGNLLYAVKDIDCL